jgi:hypothetical protein
MKLKGWNKCKGYKNKDKKGMGCEEQILGYHGLGKNSLAGRGGDMVLDRYFSCVIMNKKQRCLPTVIAYADVRQVDWLDNLVLRLRRAAGLDNSSLHTK